jgi:RNA polymerase sigma factor (sigma-70 family)
MTKDEFSFFYSQHASRLRTFILWMVRQRSVCDDILQTVFIKVWNAAKIPEDSKERELWLLSVSRNACLDHFRSGARQKVLADRLTRETIVSHPDPDEPFAWNALSVLNECERSILFLHFKLGYTFREIGTMLELTETNVRVQSFRALKQIRKHLTEKAPE